MSSDPVQRLSQLAELMRARMADGIRAQGKEPEAPAARFAGLSAPEGSRDIGQLRVAVRKGLSGLSPTDPSWGSRSRRLFLENVVAWHFGPAVLNDSAIEAVLDEIGETFEQNAALRDRLDVALRRVLDE